MSKIIELTDDNFTTEVLQSQLPVIVDYWAPWCAPCKLIAPILEVVAETYDGIILIAKLDIDEYNETPAIYAVRSIPTLMLFNGGTMDAVHIGALSKAELIAFIDSNI